MTTQTNPRIGRKYVQEDLHACPLLGTEFIRIVNDELVVSTNIDERVLLASWDLVSNRIHVTVMCTNLSKVWPLGTSEVDVDQVRFGPEGSKSEALHLLPPGKKSRESRIILGDCAATLVPSQTKRHGNRLTFFTFARMQLDL